MFATYLPLSLSSRFAGLNLFLVRYGFHSFLLSTNISRLGNDTRAVTRKLGAIPPHRLTTVAPLSLPTRSHRVELGTGVGSG